MESWILTEATEGRLDAFKMWLYRRRLDLIGGKSNQQNGYGTNEEKFRNNDHEKKTSIPWTYNEI